MAATTPVSIIVTGAAGRMGKRIIALASEQPSVYRLVGALDRPDCPLLGQDAGKIAGVADLGVPLTASLSPDMQGILIDFSAPAATRALIPLCVKNNIPMLIGTTGLTPDDHKLIDEAAAKLPILQATNTSLGVTLLLKLVGQVAAQLGPDYDIEIVEAHHNQKKDAPSGTALSLAQSICQATGRSMEKDLVHGREGKDALRQPGTIGMHAVRMGDVVGDHTVYYATPGERLELRHIATNRDTFVRGALRAASWLAFQKPGRYSMASVLGL